MRKLLIILKTRPPNIVKRVCEYASIRFCSYAVLQVMKIIVKRILYWEGLGWVNRKYHSSIFNFLIVSTGSLELKIALPAARTFTPVSISFAAFVVSIPPSTSIRTL